MDTILTEIITGLPNLAVALIALWWVSRTLDRVLDVMLTLLTGLVDAQMSAIKAAAADEAAGQELPLKMEGIR